jgi:chromosome segregation ATPase
MTSYDGHLAVERSRWTDDRLDDLAERVMRQDVLEARFESLERRFEDFQQEMREFRAEMRDFRREITAEVQSLRSELYATKRWMMTMWLSGVLAFIAVFVEISLRT